MHNPPAPECPVCGGASPLFDVVDFNKSCEEEKGRHLPLAGLPIYYARCSGCRFCFAPELAGWDEARTKRLIYNDDYLLVDPDFAHIRPAANAASLQRAFRSLRRHILHLDYGGGEGALSRILQADRWHSNSLDPYFCGHSAHAGLPKANLLTAFEVFEHHPRPRDLVAELDGLLAEDGLLLFSTLVSDGRIRPGERLGWWYAAPRNGHVSLYSRRSLAVLAQRHGFVFSSLSDGYHLFHRQLPAWAVEGLATLQATFG